MALRIPQNQIVTSKYTSGKEFMFNKTYREYIGYYYELNEKLFAGKEFNSTAPELIRINSSKVNSLLTHPTTYIYGKISGIKLNNSTISSFIYRYDSNIRYFSYQINRNLIKEIDKDTFSNFKLNPNPIYKIISLNYIGGFNDNELKEAEKIIPGITMYINNTYTNPPIEESGLEG